MVFCSVRKRHHLPLGTSPLSSSLSESPATFPREWPPAGAVNTAGAPVGVLAAFRLRYLCGYDREQCAGVLGAFVGELRRSLAWRAKRALSLGSVDEAETGTITFVQRFDSGLRLNVHYHVLALDGVYVRDASGAPIPAGHRLPIRRAGDRPARSLGTARRGVGNHHRGVCGRSARVPRVMTMIVGATLGWVWWRRRPGGFIRMRVLRGAPQIQTGTRVAAEVRGC
jgi:hypothetical protein